MQKVEGSNPFSRFPANRRLSGAGFALTGVILSHHFGHECLKTARYADDYLEKPFAYEDLRFRIDAILRLRHSRLDDPVTVGELLIDPDRRKVTVGEREIRLAKKVFTLLRVLASDPTRAFAKEELLRDVWGLRGPAAMTRTLDGHASRLRSKLDPEHRRYVVNCWGGVLPIDGWLGAVKDVGGSQPDDAVIGLQ